MAWQVVILGGVGDNNCVVDKGDCLDGRPESDGRLSDCLPSRGANRQTLTKRSMLGAGGGQDCVEDSLDGPDHFAELSCGSKSELLIGRTLDSGLSFTEAAEPTSLCFFKDACGRRFFMAAACADDGSNFQLLWGKEI
jgi:hypothetical protein